MFAKNQMIDNDLSVKYASSTAFVYLFDSVLFAKIFVLFRKIGAK